MVLSLLLLCSTVYLAIRVRTLKQVAPTAVPTQVVRRLRWSEIFAADKSADVVLDGAALGVVQELTGRQIALSESFDRSYLRSVEQSAGIGKAPARIWQRRGGISSVGSLDRECLLETKKVFVI